MGTPDLDLICLFLGHLITADGAVHNTELDTIQTFLNASSLSDTAYQGLAAILADAEEKAPLEAILQQLATAGEPTQEQALAAGLALTYSDGFLDPYEERLFEQFLARTGFPRERFLALKEQAAQAMQADDSEEVHPLAALLSTTLRPLVSALAKAGPRASRETLARLSTRLLLVGPEYERAIERCSQVAAEDFAVAERHLNRGSQHVIDLSKAITALMRDIVHRPELQEIDVRATLVRLRDTLNERLVARVEEQRRSLVKRQRALASYTISFVGRTKAGKSTLHAVVTGEGSDAIGAGMQRTTRFNRVYTWKRLRIIDTPGIGAPGGQSDEAIAESIVEESDVICYVVTNDSIQESEFKFLERIRARGKPVFILLNVKENLADERRLRIYLKNPQRWYARDDEQALQGHIERIRRYARQFYRSDMMPIFPVQLLAARLSREPAHESIAETLYRSSRLQEFLDALRVGLIEEGALRRSQTMLDGAIHTLEGTRADLRELSEPAQLLRAKLAEKRKQLDRELKRSAERARAELQQVVKAAFDRLNDVAYEFARDHYNDRSADAQKAWERELERRHFVKGLQDEITVANGRYFEQVRSFLDETAADLDAFADLRLGGFNPTTRRTGPDMRTIATIGSIVAGLGGTVAMVLALAGVAIGPVGWICTAAAVGFGFLGGMLEDKATRRQKAIQRLYQSLIKGIEGQRDQTAHQIADGLEQTRCDVERRIHCYFEALLLALDGTLAAVTNTERAVGTEVNALNDAFARRVLEFALQSSGARRAELIEVLEVQRQLGVSITISTPNAVPPAVAERVSSILQEHVAIVQPIATKARRP